MRAGHFIFLHEKLGELYIILQKYENGSHKTSPPPPVLFDHSLNETDIVQERAEATST